LSVPYTPTPPPAQTTTARGARLAELRLGGYAQSPPTEPARARAIDATNPLGMGHGREAGEPSSHRGAAVGSRVSTDKRAGVPFARKNAGPTPWTSDPLWDDSGAWTGEP
jgi:hypothetical protein